MEPKSLKDYQIIIAENVRNIRNSKQQSKTDFARSCGISVKTLNLLENEFANRLYL